MTPDGRRYGEDHAVIVPDVRRRVDRDFFAQPVVERAFSRALRRHHDTATRGQQVDLAYALVGEDAAAFPVVHFVGDRQGQPLAAVTAAVDLQLVPVAH